MNLIFDLETDGLYNDVTQVHCIGVYDLDAKESYVFNTLSPKVFSYLKTRTASLDTILLATILLCFASYFLGLTLAALLWILCYLAAAIILIC